MGQFTLDEVRVATNLLAIFDRWQPIAHVPRRVGLAICRQECNWDDQAVGDGGVSHGPFQIDTDFHPFVTAYISTDPWWDYGFPEIFRRWRDRWAPYDAKWQTADRLTRIELLMGAAPEMQGSIGWTADEAKRAYDDATAMEELLS